jgi:predicted nucleic acid-binding protein
MILPKIPSGATVLLDASIMLHGACRKSRECEDLLRRGAERDVRGVVGLPQLAEVMHRLTMLDAQDAGCAGSGNPTRTLSQHPERVRRLNKYAESMKALLATALRFEPTTKEDFHAALLLQRHYGFLTNDALLIALSDRLGISMLASADRAFERIHDLALFAPGDIG